MAAKELAQTVIEALPEDATLDDIIQALRSEATEGSVPAPKNGRDLLQALRSSGLVGKWRDREDLVDSLEFARQLRQRAQKRQKE